MRSSELNDHNYKIMSIPAFHVIPKYIPLIEACLGIDKPLANVLALVGDELVKQSFLYWLLAFEKENQRLANREQVYQELIKYGCETKCILLRNETAFLEIELFTKLGADIQVTENGYTFLHAAVIQKDAYNSKTSIEFALKNLINLKDAINSVYNPSGTPLHFLIANETFDDKKQYGVILYFIAKLEMLGTYNWNACDFEQKTPLIIATKARQLMVVETLLDLKAKGCGIDINAIDNQGRTALHFACALGMSSIVIKLIQAGANINVHDKQKRTPLHYAVMREKLVRTILDEISIDPDRDAGALHNYLMDPNNIPIESSSEVNSSKTKVTTRDKSIVEKVVQGALNMCECMNYDSEELRMFDREFISIQSKFLKGYSLIQECMKNRVDIVKFLIEKKADATLQNSNGNTPLMIIKRISKGCENTATDLDRRISEELLSLLTLDEESENRIGYQYNN